VEHRPLSGKTSRSSSPELHRPPRVATVARGNPATNGVSSDGLLRPAADVTRLVVASIFFESGSYASTLGPESKSATLKCRRSSAGQHGLHSWSNDKAGRGHVGSARGVPGFPHSVSRHCHGDSSRAEYARRKGRVTPFGGGAGSQSQLRPRGWL